ncbi:unnamed protein product, partial [Iphiclides podalirius]
MDLSIAEYWSHGETSTRKKPTRTHVRPAQLGFNSAQCVNRVTRCSNKGPSGDRTNELPLLRAWPFVQQKQLLRCTTKNHDGVTFPYVKSTNAYGLAESRETNLITSVIVESPVPGARWIASHVPPGIVPAPVIQAAN